MYRAAGLRVGHAARARTSPRCCDAWAALPLLFQPGSGVELLRRHRRARPARRGGRPASRSTSSSRSAIFEPLGMTRHRLLRAPRTTTTGSPRSTRRDPRHAARRARRRAWASAAHAAAGLLSGGGGLVSTAARLPPLHADAAAAAASSTACGCSAPRTVRYMAQQPPARRRRPRGVRPAAVRRDDVRRRRLRARLLGRRSTRSRNKVLSSPGEFGWGGAASTAFWVDPVEEHHRRCSSPSCCRRAPTRSARSSSSSSTRRSSTSGPARKYVRNH